MELTFGRQLQPKTLLSALQAIRLLEARLSVAIKWITRCHGEIPASLRAELRRTRVGVKNNVWSSKFHSSEDTGIMEKLHVVVAPVSRNLDVLYDDDWLFDPPVSSPSSPLNEAFTPKTELASDSETLAVTNLDTETPQIKIRSVLRINDMGFKHACPNCPALFDSVTALSVHSLMHLRVPLDRVDKSQQNTSYALRNHRSGRSYKENPVEEAEENPESEEDSESEDEYDSKLKRKYAKSIAGLKRSTDSRAYIDKKYLVNGKYQCDQCPKILASKKGMSKHVNKVHGCTKPCEACGLSFSTNKERLKHMREVHPDLNSRYKCDQCDKSFLLMVYLKHHKNHKHSTPDMAATCEICGKVYKNMVLLKQHQKVVHPNDPASCPTCGFQAKSAMQLRRHMNSHLPATFLCQICGYSATSKEYLGNHMRRVHDKKVRPSAPNSAPASLQCPHCPLICRNQFRLGIHIKRHFGLLLKKPCPHCGEEKYNTSLPDHIANVHQGRKFKCSVCPSMHSVKTSLRDHYALKHPDVSMPAYEEIEIIYTKSLDGNSTLDPVKKPRISNKNRKRKKYQFWCEICPHAVFGNRYGLRRHMLLHDRDPNYQSTNRGPIRRLDEEVSSKFDQIASPDSDPVVDVVLPDDLSVQRNQDQVPVPDQFQSHTVVNEATVPVTQEPVGPYLPGQHFFAYPYNHPRPHYPTNF